MAVQPTPYVEQALSHSSELFRRELQAGLPFGSAGGVVPATPTATVNGSAGVAGCSDLQVTATGGQSVAVTPGQVLVPGSLGSGSGYGIGTGYGYPTITLNGGSAPTVGNAAHATKIQLTTQGAYYCYNDGSAGSAVLNVAASDPTNPRIDVVGAQVEDAAYSGSNNDWKLTVITGVAAASPTLPTFPNNFVPLAVLWIPANSTSVASGNILDVRVVYNRNPFTAYMYLNGTQSISNGTLTGVSFDTILWDYTGMASVGSPSQFTFPVTGKWLINMGLEFGTETTGEWTMSLYGSATRSDLYRGPMAVSGGYYVSATASEVMSYGATNTAYVAVYQSSGAAHTTGGGSANFFSATLLSPA